MSTIPTVNINTDKQSDWEHYPVTLENWVAACHEEKQKKDLPYSTIARRIGYARPSLSLALSGNYTGSTDKIAAAYVSYRTQVVCPYLGETVSRGYCVEHALSAAPTHNPAALRHWRACQGCEHKPDKDGSDGS